MEVKKPMTFEEQLELIRSRGCLIGDEKFALTILKQVNYYRLSSYFLPYKTFGDKYVEDTKFLTIYKNYMFDRKLRNMLSFLLENIEVMVKTQIAYYHSLEYGPLGYLNKKNFNKKFDEDYLEKCIKKSILRNKKNPIIIHHFKKYDANFPFWVIIDLFDFSDISKLYSQLDIKLMKKIAKTIGTNYVCLSSWLYCLTHLRNCCAHYSRIYNKKMISIPQTLKNSKITLDKSIFSYILVIKELLKESSDWKNFIIELYALIEEYQEYIEIERMGFSSDWKKYIN